ncbi:MAG: hypothetical protein K9G49_00900 [Taibaiella sp.]|nr:hypothetical protein [Taibaiella sp.]
MSTKDTIHNDPIEPSSETVTQQNEKHAEPEVHAQSVKAKKTRGAQIPIKFEEATDEIKATKQSKIKGSDTVGHTDANDEIFSKKLGDFSDKLADLRQEIERLVATDFKELFRGLQSELIDKARNDIAIELKKFENKRVLLQDKINTLHRETDRLTAIDLEKHFDKHQKTLLDIFGEVNTINLTITSITQSLNNLSQGIGSVQTSIEEVNKKTASDLATLKTDLHQHLKLQGEETRNSFQLLEARLQSVAEQNERQQKQQKTNVIIQIVGMIIIIALIAIHFFVPTVTQ